MPKTKRQQGSQSQQINASPSTVSLEISHNSTKSGNDVWNKAHDSAILAMARRSINYLIMAKLKGHKRVVQRADTAWRRLPYKKDLKTLTTDKGCEFSAHGWDYGKTWSAGILNWRIFVLEERSRWKHQHTVKATNTIRKEWSLAAWRIRELPPFKRRPIEDGKNNWKFPHQRKSSATFILNIALADWPYNFV